MNKNCVNCKNKMSSVFTYRKYHYYKCKKCGVVSTFPYPTPKRILEHYTSRYAKGNYELLHDFSAFYKLTYQDFIKIISKDLKRNKIKSFRNLKVLDIGCFTGDFLYLLSKKGAIVQGIELQKDAVIEANKKMPGKIITEDIMKYKFKNTKYDIITLQGIVEHVTNPRLMLDKSYSLLNKGGMIMIQTPDSESIPARLTGRFWPPYAPVEHIHIFSKRALVEDLKKHGFEIMTVKKHIKKLPFEYIYNMLGSFGPELQKFFTPLYKSMPSKIRLISLPFYAGEMIITAVKK